MATSYSKLRGRIREVYGTQEAFADAIGRTPAYVSIRLTGKMDWAQTDIWASCELLGINRDEIGSYFFVDDVSKTKRDEA